MAYTPCAQHPLGCSADFVFVLAPMPIPPRWPESVFFPVEDFMRMSMEYTPSTDLCASLAISEIIERTKTDIVATTEHQFTPAGVTLAYVLSSSHLAAHTYPERNSIVISVNMCSEEAVAALEQMNRKFWLNFFREQNIALDSCTVRFDYIKHEGGTGCRGLVKRTLRELFS